LGQYEREVRGKGNLSDEYDTSAITGTNILDASRAISASAANIPDLALQSQLYTLQQERAATAAEVSSLQGDIQELESEKDHINPQLLAAKQKQLADAQARLQQMDQQIAALLAQPMLGIVPDDGQPFPIFGWLEVGYLAPQATG
jgi:chromosome segregation ATPase